MLWISKTQLEFRIWYQVHEIERFYVGWMRGTLVYNNYFSLARQEAVMILPKGKGREKIRNIQLNLPRRTAFSGKAEGVPPMPVPPRPPESLFWSVHQCHRTVLVTQDQRHRSHEYDIDTLCRNKESLGGCTLLPPSIPEIERRDKVHIRVLW